MAETQQGLSELEALRLLVHNSSDMLSRHAPDGTYLSVSRSCGDLLGYVPEELIGHSAYEFFHPDDLTAIQESHQRVMEIPDVTTVEYRIRHKAGHWVWFETTSTTVRDDATGDVVEIHTASRDVTDRREREERLRQSEAQFRSSMENAPIGIALVGTDGSWLDVNDRLCQIVGRGRDELLAMTFQDITHPDDLDADLGHVQSLLDGDRNRYAMEKRYLHADGRVVPILLSVSLVRDESGAPVHFISQIQDITDRKLHEHEMERLNNELVQSNAELERFAMVASHDLRSPLTTIGSLLGMLDQLAGEELSDTGLDLLGRARRNVDKLLEIFDALLDLARVQVRQGDVEQVRVGAVLEGLAEALTVEFEQVDAELEVGDLPAVRMEPAHLHVVLQNLLANALKYRDPSRSLRVCVHGDTADDEVRIVVEDNGRGFDPVDHDVMFQPFGRTASGVRVEGAGIGLATCRRIVEQYGGSIRAEPLHPGARFVVTLPAPA